MKIITRRKWRELNDEHERRLNFYKKFVTNHDLLEAAEKVWGPMPHGISQRGLAELIIQKFRNQND